MTHPEASLFVSNIMRDGHGVGKAVLELGSFNVNGTVRDYFQGAGRYVGVDWRPGDCVDHVSLFHEIPWRGEFDILVSVNTFEHDPYWKKSLAAGVAALKHGGELIISIASDGYPEHERDCAPQPGYYHNVSASEFAKEIELLGLNGTLVANTGPPDLTFHGFKDGYPKTA